MLNAPSQWTRSTWVRKPIAKATAITSSAESRFRATLQCLANTPLTEDQKLSTVLLVSGHVRNEATLSADIAAASGGQPVMPGYGSLLRRLTTAERFPALHRAIDSGSLDDDDDLDTEFNFGLERILDGIESLIDRTYFGKSVARD